MAMQLFPHNLKLSLAKCEHTHTHGAIYCGVFRGFAEVLFLN